MRPFYVNESGRFGPYIDSHLFVHPTPAAAQGTESLVKVTAVPIRGQSQVFARPDDLDFKTAPSAVVDFSGFHFIAVDHDNCLLS
jgi:predicted glycoside hydrolase/deacetylase ChbG (UPF0249 family)